MRKWSQPTEYAGRMYRSALEATYAERLAACGIGCVYEPYAVRARGVTYLPDFRLPRSGQWIEVKPGFPDDADARKIGALIGSRAPRAFTDETTPDIPLVLAMPAGEFVGYVRPAGRVVDWRGYFAVGRAVEFARCVVCRNWWAMDPDGGWQCQCCGTADGNGHISDRFRSPWPTGRLP